MRTHGARLLRIFVTGALAALPLSATILIVVWIVSLLFAWIGPGSLVGRLLGALGLGISASPVVGYLAGVCVMIAGIFGLGLFIESRWVTLLQAGIDTMVQRIPLVRNVYDLTQRFVDLLSQRDKEGLRSMSPVWCHFGGPGGAAVLGLLSTPEPVAIGGLPYHGVLVPTAPVPVGGGLLYVPADWITQADIGVDGLTSIYVSMGVTSNQHLGRHVPAPHAVMAPGTAVATAAPPAQDTGPAPTSPQATTPGPASAPAATEGTTPGGSAPVIPPA